MARPFAGRAESRGGEPRQDGAQQVDGDRSGGRSGGRASETRGTEQEKAEATTGGTASAALLLRPTGRLEADSCGELRHQLGAAFAAGVSSVAVDLRAVTSVDPTGLGVLAGAARHLRSRGGVLVVSHASPAVATKLRINGLGDLLDVAPAPLRAVPRRPAGDRAASRAALSVVPDDGLKLPG